MPAIPNRNPPRPVVPVGVAGIRLSVAVAVKVQIGNQFVADAAVVIRAAHPRHCVGKGGGVGRRRRHAVPVQVGADGGQLRQVGNLNQPILVRVIIPRSGGRRPGRRRQCGRRRRHGSRSRLRAAGRARLRSRIRRTGRGVRRRHRQINPIRPAMGVAKTPFHAAGNKSVSGARRQPLQQLGSLPPVLHILKVKGIQPVAALSPRRVNVVIGHPADAVERRAVHRVP